MFNELFNRVDKVETSQEVEQLMEVNKYDFIISDVNIDLPKGTIIMKEIKEKRPEQEIVALASLKDEGNLAELVDLGIHAFLIMPNQFEQALEAITQMELS